MYMYILVFSRMYMYIFICMYMYIFVCTYILSYKSDASALRALGAIFLIAPLFLIAYSQ